MNREEAYKLLGGYATNSLTDEERRVLFEAALDDQELFNALGDEQALKELLDDPFSREQLRRAAASTPRRSWLRAPWIWATAGIVAISALTMIVVRQQQPPLASKPQAQVSTMARVEKPAEALAPAQPAPEKQEIRTELSKPAVKRREPAAVAPVREQPAPAVPAASPVQAAPPQETAVAQVAPAQQLPPPPAPPEQQQLRADSIQRQAAGAPGGGFSVKSAPTPAVAGFRDTEKTAGAGGFAGVAAMKKDLGTSYFLSRREGSGAFIPAALQTVFRAGDIVRITVIPASAGRLSMETRAGPTGEWKRIFPPSGESVEVAAGRPFAVPVDVEVAPDLRLRLILAPAGGGPPVATGVPLRVAP